MSVKELIKYLIEAIAYEQLFVAFLIDPIEILAVVDGTQQALASAVFAAASLKTGIESKV
jgi:hypothetical protein